MLICRLPVAKSDNFGQILTFLGLPCRPPFTDEGQIWCAIADSRSTLTRQISSECVHCLRFRWPKNHNFGQIDFWAPVSTPPFTDEGQIWCTTADPLHTLTCQNSSRSVYFVAVWGRKTPIFADFWTSAFSGVDSWRQSEKVEHGCTTTNLSLSNGIKIVSVLQRLHGEIWRTISDVQKRDRQTNRETNKKTQRFWPPRQRVKSEPHQTWHCTVIEDLEHVLAPVKLLGV